MTHTRLAGVLNVLKVLGPGLITGASDDDPSGIGTYSQAGSQFGYGVLWHRQGEFEVMITVRGKRSIRDWRLAFAMSGDQINYVSGAWFKATGHDAVMVSDMGDQATGDGGHDGPGSPDASGDMYAINFMVVGQGTPVLPTDCSYDGASCTFK